MRGLGGQITCLAELQQPFPDGFLLAHDVVAVRVVTKNQRRCFVARRYDSDAFDPVAEFEESADGVGLGHARTHRVAYPRHVRGQIVHERVSVAGNAGVSDTGG